MIATDRSARIMRGLAKGYLQLPALTMRRFHWLVDWHDAWLENKERDQYQIELAWERSSPQEGVRRELRRLMKASKVETAVIERHRRHLGYEYQCTLNGCDGGMFLVPADWIDPPPPDPAGDRLVVLDLR